MKELEFDVEIEGRIHCPSEEILSGKDFVQLRDGPFDLDIVFAPDGFNSYEEPLPMKKIIDGLPILSIEGIIKAKEAAGRKKDLNELDDQKAFAAWRRDMRRRNALD